MTSDYDRIASAITYIQDNFRKQPSLDEVARHISLSPFHFQKLFTQWAGVSPKKFLQFLTIGHAKNMLRAEHATLFDSALEAGLSGTGRLHDLFVSIEGMTPAEFRNGGSSLTINYTFSQTPFGMVIVASTSRGVCYLAFADDEQHAFHHLQQQFPNAEYRKRSDEHQVKALSFFNKEECSEKLQLHLKGTPFQMKVWEALLKIPMGRISTYLQIAGSISNAKASRAVGSAVGDNPVAFIIPCHRVIRSTGDFGEYHWGPVRKTAIIGWEAAAISGSSDR